MSETATAQLLKRTRILYGVSTYLTLWIVAGLLDLLPAWLQLDGLWGGLIAALLWLLAYRTERRYLKTAEADRATPREPEKPAQRRAAVTPVDQQLEEALEFKARADEELAEEAEDFATMRKNVAPESFSGPGTIDLTFEDLGRLPTLVMQAIREQMDDVPARERDEILNRRKRDRYHVRDDGERYDLRTLRSVG